MAGLKAIPWETGVTVHVRWTIGLNACLVSGAPSYWGPQVWRNGMLLEGVKAREVTDELTDALASVQEARVACSRNDK